ncbi:MAG: PA containing protein [Pseudonocardiaceae bacterium]|nr:PA containing protein [Pseudonocardiaceae bacterium]
MGFDRMRNMLVRAAEIRESEQQQIFDTLDDIHAKLSPLESIGAVRKRLSELPDRTEVSVLAERLDEAMAKLEAQETSITAVSHAVEAIVDKLAKPFAQLDGRLDGVAGKFEGVAGRMDGLEDKLQNIHRRLDELDLHLDKQDGRLESLPGAVHGPVRERIEVAETGLRSRVDEVEENTQSQLDTAKDALSSELRSTRDSASDKLDTLGDRLDRVTARLDEMATRLDTVEENVGSRIGELGGSIDKGLSKVESTVSDRPNTESVTSLVQRSNEESERRIGEHLDEAMATFGELMFGSVSPQQTSPAPPMPRQARRTRGGGGSNKSKSGTKSRSTGGDSETDDTDSSDNT